MRRINIAACSLMLLAAASAPAMAQGNMGGMDPAQMVQRSTDRLMTGITLSATESDSVKAINARYVTSTQAAMSSGDRSQMGAMRTKQHADLRAILTPDQQTMFDKNVADMEKARMNRQKP